MKKVLIVDDDPDVLEAVGLVLEQAGYEIYAISHSEETMAIISQFQPDLVVLDFLLSGANGGNIARKVRQQTTNKQLPIVMISAHPSARAAAADVGINCFLAKPFEAEDLLNAVAQFTNVR